MFFPVKLFFYFYRNELFYFPLNPHNPPPSLNPAFTWFFFVPSFTVVLEPPHPIVSDVKIYFRFLWSDECDHVMYPGTVTQIFTWL